MFCYYYQLSNNKNRSNRIECVNSKKRYFKMSLDKSSKSKLSDSSRKLIPRKRRKSMNDLFVDSDQKREETFELSCALHLPFGEPRLLLVQFCARKNYDNQYPPCVLKKRPLSDLKLPLATQTLPPLSNLLSVLSLAKLVCQTLIHMTRGVLENSSTSISRHLFRISFKKFFFFKISIH